MLCRQFARSGETKESVSNDDGDGNKNGKKAMGYNNNFARRSRYLYISGFAVTARLQRATFYFHVLLRT